MVDMKGLQGGVVALTAIIITVVLSVIIVQSIEDNDVLTPVNSTGQLVTQNGSDILGQVITTWGTIILLGLVVVFIFVGMLLALNLLNRTNDR